MDIEEAEATLHRERARLLAITRRLVEQFWTETELLPSLVMVDEEGRVRAQRGLVLAVSLVAKPAKEPEVAIVPKTRVEQGVLELAAKYFEVPLPDLLRSRKEPALRARRVCIFLLREKLALSYPRIGSLLGKNHSTVIYQFKQAKEELEDPDFRTDLGELEFALKQFPEGEPWPEKTIADDAPIMTVVVLTEGQIIGYPAREVEGRLRLEEEHGLSNDLLWIQYGPRALQKIGELVHRSVEKTPEANSP